MREIALNSQKLPKMYALVDDGDYKRVAKYKWQSQYSHGRYYARATIRTDGRRITVRMHKFITGFALTDHKDRNGLNNQRNNLRDASSGANSANKKAQERSSRFKGVGWNSDHHKWRARIMIDYKTKHLGHYDSESDAARAYDRAAVEAWGEFACTNQMLGLYDD